MAIILANAEFFFHFWKYPKMAKKGQNLVTAVTRDLIGRPEPNCAHIIRSLRRRENDPLLVSTYCLSDRNAISRDLISRFKPNLAHIIQCLWVLVQDCSLFSSYYLSDKVAWSRNGKLQNEIFLTVHSIPVYVYHYYVQLRVITSGTICDRDDWNCFISRALVV